MTTGAAASPSSADSWSIGFREPRLMSARMQSGLSDLGVPVEMARENGMRYPYKTEHFLTFTFSPQHNLSFYFHSVLFLYPRIIVFPKI